MSVKEISQSHALASNGELAPNGELSLSRLMRSETAAMAPLTSELHADETARETAHEGARTKRLDAYDNRQSAKNGVVSVATASSDIERDDLKHDSGRFQKMRRRKRRPGPRWRRWAIRRTRFGRLRRIPRSSRATGKTRCSSSGMAGSWATLSAHAFSARGGRTRGNRSRRRRDRRSCCPSSGTTIGSSPCIRFLIENGDSTWALMRRAPIARRWKRLPKNWAARWRRFMTPGPTSPRFTPTPTCGPVGVHFDFENVPVSDYALGPGSDYDSVLRYVQGFPGFFDGVRRMEPKFVVNGFVHGDLKFDNIFLDEATPSGVRLIDIDDVGPGDRAWDLGVVVGELIRHWLDSVDIADLDDLEASLGSARIPFESIQGAIRAFCARYGQSEANRTQIAQRGDLVLYFAGRHLITSVVSTLAFNAKLARSHWARLHIGANLVAAPDAQLTLLREDGA